ncbi:MAG: aromatic acid exporter family protein [Lachnospiraceae bacterium]|nr:aromatic acid exporter family protein [Lachnospiraceae bacterium]
MRNIIINSIKIIIAAILAIVLAQLLKLEFAISAGIVAILTIQPTKKETVATALGRLYAFIVALVIAYVSFSLIGYNVTAFFVYLVFFIFVCQIFKWYSAMAMNSVLISHFVTFGSMNKDTVINEILIFIIGVGIGVIANLHLRKRKDYIEKLKNETDAQIVKILKRMSNRIQDKDLSDYNGECFQILNKQIAQAQHVAELNYKNQFQKDDIFDQEYISMRDRQRHVLYEMYKDVRRLNSTPGTAQRISDFLNETANVFDKNNDAIALMEQFQEMSHYMKSQSLPVTREEFEDRARLFSLLCNLEEFLQIKMEFSKKYL